VTEAGVRIRLDRALRHTQRQHAELAQLERELQRAIDRDDSDAIDRWLSRYSSGLLAHFVLEEDVLFPILGQLGPDADSGVVELVDQHEDMRNELSSLSAASNAYTVAAGLAALRVHVAAHESLEERLATDALSSLEIHHPAAGSTPRRSPL